jgi:hypothetical protein
MATLTPTLTLVSSDALSDAISISETDSLTVTNPAETSKISVLHSGATELAAVSVGAYYLYVKNVSSTNSKPVDIRIAAGTAFGQIATGEFAFIPMKVNLGVELIAIDETVTCEYAIFKKG